MRRSALAVDRGAAWDEDSEALKRDQYPRLANISAGFLQDVMLHPKDVLPVEYIYVPMPAGRRSLVTVGRLALWNNAWEAAQLRNRIKYFVRELPPVVRPIVRLREDINVTFVPRWNHSRYNAYAPLFHLLPRRTLERFGLPALRMGNWPALFEAHQVLPPDFDTRLERAFAMHIWPHLVPGSHLDGFSRDDPIRLLAHNLDYWLGPVTEMIQDQLRSYGRPQIIEPEVAAKIEKARADLEHDESGILVDRPLRGGDLWRGEEDAAAATADLVDRADARGQLRGILDAVRSTRVEEDFSSRWSYAREDLERRLYSKRRKIKIKFVELTDTIPVHGPESEVEGRLLYEDFLAVLDKKERQVVVLLRSGVTKVGEVASLMGYANHSPVSKALTRIRRKAAAFFDAAD